MDMTERLTYIGLSWLKFDKRCDVVCTEVGRHYIKDVCGIVIDQEGRAAEMIEIEVKTSLSDVRADFRNKAYKHELYAAGKSCPNYLYFLVAPNIATEATAIVKAENPKYGVLTIDPNDDIINAFFAGKLIRSLHRVTRLTSDKPKQLYLKDMANRIMNEYMFMKHDLYLSGIRRHNDIAHWAKAISKADLGNKELYSKLAEGDVV